MNKDLQEAQRALAQAIEYIRRQEMFKGDREHLAKEISQAVASAIEPHLARMQAPTIDTGALVEAIKGIQVATPSVHVEAPQIPDIIVPEQKAPQVSVNVPKNTEVVNELKKVTKAISEQKPIDIPKHPVYTMKEPMPVIMTDLKGDPWSPFSSGGGNKLGLRFIDSTGKERIVSDEFPMPVDASLTISDTLDVRQVSGSTDSVSIKSSDVSFETKQVSGFIDSVKVTGFDSSIGVSLLGGDGSTYDARDRTWTITESLETRQISGYTDSVAIKSTDVSFETKQVSGFTDSVFVTGFADSVTVHQARTTNPTAATDGADVRPATDDLRRTLITPIQVRDLRATAYATLSNGTETTLLAAGGAGVFHDLIYVLGANTSGAAVQVDFRSVTGGNVEFTLEIPSGGTAGKALPVPWPQGNANNNWTADMPDITGTTVYISGLFSKEV